MDILSEAKSLYKELMNEYSETINKMDKEQQEQLWNILKADNLTIEQKKKLFLESLNTSRYYKLSQMMK